jgi:hypothetical protein
LSRLFVSHSSKDKVAAIAFKQWLCSGKDGWPPNEVFLDLDDINAGERWKEALKKAHDRCEAVILLASPDALSSPECLAEVRKAEDFGKEIVVVLLHDLTVDDRRLGSLNYRQIVDLAQRPQTHIEIIEHDGEQHKVHFNGDALASIKSYLIKRGLAPEHFAWPPVHKQKAEPFPGLSAFTEDDAGIFFGRDSDILRGLDKIRVLRRNGRPRFLVIQAASGAGKSSYLRAGLWPRLDRDPDFASIGILRPAEGTLTGPKGLGSRLAAQLSRPAQPVSPGQIHARLMALDTKRASTGFSALLRRFATQAHEQRRVGEREARVPVLILAIDQAEEMFGQDNATENERFLFLLANFLRESPAGVELFCLFTIRNDEASQLFQAIAHLDLEVPETFPLLPLPPGSYRDVLLKPLEVLAQRGQRLTIDPALPNHLVADATGADALPLLAFTISHLYREFSVTGKLTLEQYEGIGGVSGSIEMALRQALARPSDAPAIPTVREEQLKLIRTALIPWLARVDPDTGVAMRRITLVDKIPESCRAIVQRLIKARLLVSDRHSGFDVVEIAHESFLRQWPPLTEWLQAEAADLKVLEIVGRAAREWVRNGCDDSWLDHRAERLDAADRVAKRDDFGKRLGEEDLAYLRACFVRERTERIRRTLVAVGRKVLAIGEEDTTDLNKQTQLTRDLIQTLMMFEPENRLWSERLN